MYQILSAAAETTVGKNADISSWLVILLGLGTVFVGLMVIILICKLMSLFLSNKKEEEKSEPATRTSAAAPTPAQELTPQQHGELVAVIATAIAEELGTDISGIRIHSIRKV